MPAAQEVERACTSGESALVRNVSDLISHWKNNLNNSSPAVKNVHMIKYQGIYTKVPLGVPFKTQV